MIEREIVIRLPKTPRRRWLLLAMALVMAASAAGYATVPNLFNAGDMLSSAKLNGNFAALDDRVSDLESTYCGSTSAVVDARLSATNGYVAGATLCAAVNGCGPKAHICTPPELLRWVTAGHGDLPEGWIATGTYTLWGSNSVDDCGGFTSNLSTDAGMTWKGFKRGLRFCNNNTLPVHCCD